MDVGHNRCVQMFRFGGLRTVGNEVGNLKLGAGWDGEGRGKVENVVLYKPLHTPIMAHASGRFRKVSHFAWKVSHFARKVSHLLAFQQLKFILGKNLGQ